MSKKPSVSTLHPEYSESVKRWELIRAIINNNAQSMIRNPDVNDLERSKQYRSDAILTNFTKLTRDGLTGLVFRKPPEVDLPPELQYLLDDATGSGINLYQFSQHTISETISLGRYGLLNDYNNEAKKGFIKPYAPEAIINWKTRMVGGVVMPWLIVLAESIVNEDPENPFNQDVKKQYRVLRLDNNDVYYQEIYNEDEDLVDVIPVVDAQGRPLNYIPFVFIGSSNNDPIVDAQPLYDISIVNLGHYRCSADLIESSWICGQPTYHLDVGETTEEEFKANNQSMVVGSRKMVITKGGRLDIIQASPNQLVSQIMKDLIEQAAAIGAKLIEGAQGTRETAEGARIRYGSQNSALYVLSKNVQWAIEACLKIQCAFMDADPELVEYELNEEFFEPTADPNLIIQQIMLLDRGVIGKEDIRDYGRRTGWIDPMKTDDMIDAEVEQNDPLMGAENVTAQRVATTPNPIDAAD